MSKKLSLVDLEGIGEKELKETIINYSEALNQANANVVNVTTVLKTKEEEILKLNEAVKVLHETNNKLNLSLTEALAQLEQQDTGVSFKEEEVNEIIEKYNASIKIIEEKDINIKGLQETVNLFKKEKNKNLDKVVEVNLKKIEDLNLVIESLKKENNALLEKIKLFNTDKGFVAKKESDIILQTYNIKGWDNRTGTASSGGREFNKAVILIKLVDNTLFWNIESKYLEYSSRHQLVLDDINKGILEKEIVGKGSFNAIKIFLQIPESMENSFPDGRYIHHIIEQ